MRWCCHGSSCLTRLRMRPMMITVSAQLPRRSSSCTPTASAFQWPHQQTHAYATAHGSKSYHVTRQKVPCLPHCDEAVCFCQQTIVTRCCGTTLASGNPATLQHTRNQAYSQQEVLHHTPMAPLACVCSYYSRLFAIIAKHCKVSTYDQPSLTVTAYTTSYRVHV
jgi:hypothetical protein